MKNIFALDFGTTKFCLSSLIYDRKEKDVNLVIRKLAAGGMHRGMVADLALAKNNLNLLVRDFEHNFKIDVTEAVVGIAGHHVSHRIVRCETEIKKNKVDQQLCYNLGVVCRSENGHPDREILHLLPLSYTVDRMQPTMNPIGFSGHLIRAEYLLIDADRNYVKDVVSLCNHAGIQVLRLYSESYASAEVSTADEQKELGVAVIDIGGGTSDGIVYQDGKPTKNLSVGIGGQMMTNDIAVAFNLRLAEAEKAKKHFGLINRGEVLSVHNMYGKQIELKSSEIYKVLGCRVYELAELIGAELKPFKNRMGAGLILTGGGAQVKGITEFMAKLYQVPVVHTPPHYLSLNEHIKVKNNEEAENSRYATALGLMKIYLEEQFAPADSLSLKRPLKQLLNWFKELS